MDQTQVLLCQLCGKGLCGGQHGQGNETNYQKLVDPPAALYGNEITEAVRENFYPPACTGPPLITCTPCVEYRVTSEVRGKPANIPGLLYIMNHGFMERADVETWIEKKKKMAEKNLSWVGDGTYVETHPNMLHFYGSTTHLFLKNPDKPYGNSPPPKAPYKQILPDHRYDEEEKKMQKRKGKTDCKQICISIPVAFGQSDDKGESKKVEESEAKEKKEKEKEEKKEKETETNASSPVTKASCLPMGGKNCPPPVKMMLCLPCPPPDGVGQASGSRTGHGGQSACKPKDYAYRCESRELRAGNLYSCCQCVKRNGLQHDCPRTPCQGRPACLTKPWPDCWPSGGCHGIDFTREKGTKRYNPCSAQRFDNKVCGPSGAAKADCGGQMMVVVCPPPK